MELRSTSSSWGAIEYAGCSAKSEIVIHRKAVEWFAPYPKVRKLLVEFGLEVIHLDRISIEQHLLVGVLDLFGKLTSPAVEESRIAP